MNPLIHTIKYSFFTLLFLNHLHILTSQNPEKQILSYEQFKLDRIIMEHGLHGNNLQRDPRLHKNNIPFQLPTQQKISKIEIKLTEIETNKEQAISDLKNGLNRLEDILLNSNQLCFDMLLNLQTSKNSFYP